MKKHTYINSNIERIRKEMSMGLVPCSIIRHWEIYCRYDYYKKAGNSCSLSAIYTGDDFRVSDRMVFKIAKKMEEEL